MSENFRTVSLPAELSARLREAAEINSITEFKECLDELVQGNPDLHQFAADLRHLAEGQNTNEILDIFGAIPDD